MSFCTSGQDLPHSRNFAIIARTNWAQAYWFLSFFSWKMEGMGEQGHIWPMTIWHRNRLDTASAHSCFRLVMGYIVYRHDKMWFHNHQANQTLFSPYHLGIPVLMIDKHTQQSAEVSIDGWDWLVLVCVYVWWRPEATLTLFSPGSNEKNGLWQESWILGKETHLKINHMF